MNFPALGAAILLIGLANFVFASEPLPLPANKVTVEVAAPPIEGTVSIGVFDGAGNCVRVLFKGVITDQIPSALNGFALSWDGKTDAGNAAPDGQYEIRGVTVGNITVEAEAYHFNDWITNKYVAPLKSIIAVRFLPNGYYLMSNDASQLRSCDGEYWSYSGMSPAAKMIDLALLKDKPYAIADQKLIFEKDAGIDRAPAALDGIICIASNGSELFGILGNQLLQISPDTFESLALAEVPAGIVSMAGSGATMLLSDGNRIFKKSGDHFDRIDLPIAERITHLAMARPDTFWISTRDATLTEFNLEGEPLRSLDAEGEDTFLTFDVSASNDKIALVSKKQDRERFRVLELAALPSAEVSLWKTTLQKDIQPCEQFGIDSSTQKVVAQGELPPAKTISVPSIDNPLTPGRKNTISLTLVSRPDGLWLSSTGGLPLLLLAPDFTSQRMTLLPGKKSDSVRIFAGVEGAVAEFSCSGLSKMMQFTSEKIQWPPGSRQPADEKNVPNTEPAPTP